MRFPIDLDDQACFEANKIDDIAPYDVLASELSSVHAMRSQPRPQQLFTVGQVMAQVARTLVEVGIAVHLGDLRGRSPLRQLSLQSVFVQGC